MKGKSDLCNRLFLYFTVLPATIIGVAANQLFEFEKPYCLGILLAVTIFLIPAMAWAKDVICRYRFQAAVEKELNRFFGFKVVGKGLARRLIITVR